MILCLPRDSGTFGACQSASTLVTFLSSDTGLCRPLCARGIFRTLPARWGIGAVASKGILDPPCLARGSNYRRSASSRRCSHPPQMPCNGHTPNGTSQNHHGTPLPTTRSQIPSSIRHPADARDRRRTWQMGENRRRIVVGMPHGRSYVDIYRRRCGKSARR